MNIETVRKELEKEYGTTTSISPTRAKNTIVLLEELQEDIYFTLVYSKGTNYNSKNSTIICIFITFVNEGLFFDTQGFLDIETINDIALTKVAKERFILTYIAETNDYFAAHVIDTSKNELTFGPLLELEEYVSEAQVACISENRLAIFMSDHDILDMDNLAIVEISDDLSLDYVFQHCISYEDLSLDSSDSNPDAKLIKVSEDNFKVEYKIDNDPRVARVYVHYDQLNGYIYNNDKFEEVRFKQIRIELTKLFDVTFPDSELKGIYFMGDSEAIVIRKGKYGRFSLETAVLDKGPLHFGNPIKLPSLFDVFNSFEVLSSNVFLVESQVMRPNHGSFCRAIYAKQKNKWNLIMDSER